jgi:hypothetical protein
MINDRREATLKATKKRESQEKISTKVTPTQKRKTQPPRNANHRKKLQRKSLQRKKEKNSHQETRITGKNFNESHSNAKRIKNSHQETRTTGKNFNDFPLLPRVIFSTRSTVVIVFLLNFAVAVFFM